MLKHYATLHNATSLLPELQGFKNFFSTYLKSNANNVEINDKRASYLLHYFLPEIRFNFALVSIHCPKMHGTFAIFVPSVSSDISPSSFVTSSYLSVCVSLFIVLLSVRVHNTGSVPFSLTYSSIYPFILTMYARKFVLFSLFCATNLT